MRIVGIIQARLGSTRLPGKVLLPLLGNPMLLHVIERTRRASGVNDVIVALPDTPSNLPLVDLCREQGWPFFCGSDEDLLDRYYLAARHFKADAIVRITSDCPLIEPLLIDRVLDTFKKLRPDHCSLFVPRRTFPRGLDVECVKFSALERAWMEDRNPLWREHATLYIRRHPECFDVCGVTHPKDLSHLRWTVDTPEDFSLVERIYSHFGHNRFQWTEVLALVQANPEWSLINAHIEQKRVAL